MAILVLNLGSSSLKAAVFDASGTERLWSASHSGLGDLGAWLEPALAPVPRLAYGLLAYYSQSVSQIGRA